MFKRIFAFLAFALLGTQCWAQTTGCCGIDQPPCATGETIYISTFTGNQILKVVDAVTARAIKYWSPVHRTPPHQAF